MFGKKKQLMTAQTAGTVNVYVPVDSDFVRKDNAGEIAIDSNFSSQSFWKDVTTRFIHKKSAVIGLVFVILITLMAIIGPKISGYSFSAQNLQMKNLAPRMQVIENLGILDGSEKMKTTTGTKLVNEYAAKKLYDTFYWFGTDRYGRDIFTST